jgi:hypothetical protein
MQYINIERISVAGANENNSISEILDFLKEHPQAEVGIGVSKKKGEEHTPRNEFVKELSAKYSKEVKEVYLNNACCGDYPESMMGTIGLHVNGSAMEGDAAWPYMVMDGRMPTALRNMLDAVDSMQVNFTNCFGDSGFEDKKIEMNFQQNWSLYDCRYLFAKKKRLILPYNDTTHKLLKRIRYKWGIGSVVLPNENKKRQILPEIYTTYKLIKRFRMGTDLLQWELNVLYDASFGEGKSAEKYDRPVFHDVCQGYAGGFSPENIAGELDKIEAAQTEKVPVYIDAETGVRGDKKCLDLSKAALFCQNIRNTAYGYGLDGRYNRLSR